LTLADLDPLLALLKLPVRPEAQLKVSTPQILERRPDLLSTVLTMLFERFPTLTSKEIMVIAGIPIDQPLHTRAAQDLLDRGRQEGEARGEARGRAAEAAAVTLRQLGRRCGPLSEATNSEIQALPLEQLEGLAEALQDFTGPVDLAAWLADHTG
jgi:predicted transposase YdaD